MKKIITITLLFACLSASLVASPLVDTKWLNNNLDNKSVRIIDIRNQIDGGSIEDFKKSHIPGAVYSNYITDGWRVRSEKGVPGVFPKIPIIESLIRKLGIKNNHQIVIISGGTSARDFAAAARVYWTFKSLSHENVSILDGGYKEWLKAGLKTESGFSKAKKSKFKAKFTDKYFATAKKVEQAIEDNAYQIVDSRPYKQFIGESKSRAVSKYGRIKTSKSLVPDNITLANSSKLKSKDEIKYLLLKSGLNINENQITYCNTGHWSSVGWFALSEVLGIKNVTMYDGSLADWDSLNKEIINL